MSERSGPRWPLRRRAAPAGPLPPRPAEPARPTARGGLRLRRPLGPPDGLDRTKVLAALALNFACLAVLFSWGSWTYTGPEFVACPGGPCYSTLYQIEVPVLNGIQFAALAVASGYPLVAWFDPRRPQRLLGIAATVAVACALCVRVVDPASVVDLADGGFLFPIATLTTAGALAVFVLSSGVLCWGLASGVAWRRPRRSPPSPAQVLRDILEQGPPAP